MFVFLVVLDFVFG